MHTNTVRKNITLSADAHLIEKARSKARKERKTLNSLFRQWMGRYVLEASRGRGYSALMNRLSHVDSSRKFTRDELNER